ncbi:MAG: M48 family metalloprotease [Nitrospinae bacterium]|nr:M48 family metalloprotease [Nitrospinota bacterium]
MLILRFLLLIAAILTLTSCATTNIKPFSSQEENMLLEDDENRLWKRAQEEEERLDNSGYIYQDRELENYVNEVLNKIIPENLKEGRLKFHVRVINDPLLNAFTFPDGRMYIHTGMLARIDNEAQLAIILGHEVTHAINRHLTKQYRDILNKTAFLQTFGITTAGLGGGIIGLLGGIATIAAVNGYSKDLEREADKNGLKLIYDAGYDLNESPKVFEALKKNYEIEKAKEPFFFGSHPRLQERIDGLNALIKEDYPEQTMQDNRIKDTEKFLMITRNLLLYNAMLDMKMGRFETAKVTIDKYIRQKPDDPRGYYFMAEVYRQRSEQPLDKKSKETAADKLKDKEKAMGLYKESIALVPDYAEPHKGLGYIYYKSGDKENADTEFKKYIEISPLAEDRLYIEQYINN